MFGRGKFFLIILLGLLTLTPLVAAENETAEETISELEIADLVEEDLAISPQPTTESTTKRGVRGQAIIIPSVVVICFIFCCY